MKTLHPVIARVATLACLALVTVSAGQQTSPATTKSEPIDLKQLNPLEALTIGLPVAKVLKDVPGANVIAEEKKIGSPSQKAVFAPVPENPFWNHVSIACLNDAVASITYFRANDRAAMRALVPGIVTCLLENYGPTPERGVSLLLNRTEYIQGIALFWTLKDGTMVAFVCSPLDPKYDTIFKAQLTTARDRASLLATLQLAKNPTPEEYAKAYTQTEGFLAPMTPDGNSPDVTGPPAPPAPPAR